MSNRTLLVLIGVVLVGMLFLLGNNLKSIFEVEESEVYIEYNDIRGMAVIYRGKPFTLNFDQQTAAIGYLNQAKPISMGEIPTESNGPLRSIEKIIIYRFNGLADIEMTPIRYIDDNLVFSAPLWHQRGYLIEQSGGKLRTLLSQTYDSNTVRDSKFAIPESREQPSLSTSTF